MEELILPDGKAIEQLVKEYAKIKPAVLAAPVSAQGLGGSPTRYVLKQKRDGRYALLCRELENLCSASGELLSFALLLPEDCCGPEYRESITGLIMDARACFATAKELSGLPCESVPKKRIAPSVVKKEAGILAVRLIASLRRALALSECGRTKARLRRMLDAQYAICITLAFLPL